MAPLSLALALIVGLFIPASANDGDAQLKEISKSYSNTKGGASGEKYDKYMEQYHALMKQYKAATTQKERDKLSAQISSVKSVLSELKQNPSGAQTSNKLDPEKIPVKPSANGSRGVYGENQGQSSAGTPMDSVEGQGGDMTAAPTETSIRAQEEAARGMSRSSSRAMNAASRAAAGLRQVMPQLGDQPAGEGGKDGLLKAGGGAPDPNADLALARGGAHGQTMRAMGLDVRTGNDGRAQIVRSDGVPAQPGEVAELRRRMAVEPAALQRYPTLYAQVSRERYSELKNAYGTPGTSAAFRDIAVTPAARDFLWSRSCSKVSGDCNAYSAASHYQRGDYVPPSTLNNIWEALPDDELTPLGGTTGDEFADSEYTEEDEAEAKAALDLALRSKGTSFMGLSSLLARVQAAAGGWLGGGQAGEQGAVWATAVAVPGTSSSARAAATTTRAGRRASAGEPRTDSPSWGGSPRTGSRSIVSKLLAALSLLLLIIGVTLRRR